MRRRLADWLLRLYEWVDPGPTESDVEVLKRWAREQGMP